MAASTAIRPWRRGTHPGSHLRSWIRSRSSCTTQHSAAAHPVLQHTHPFSSQAGLRALAGQVSQLVQLTYILLQEAPVHFQVACLGGAPLPCA